MSPTSTILRPLLLRSLWWIAASTMAIANGGIYRYHLWQHWLKLQENPSLIEAYTKVVTAKQGISLNPVEIYKLDNLGVISYEGDRVKPRCELYRAYFEKQLPLINDRGSTKISGS